MGPRAAYAPAAGGIVLTRGKGSNVFCADNNRYVDLAAGFGALLLGHAHPQVLQTIEGQSKALLQALGDVYPSDRKISLLHALGNMHPSGFGQVIVGQSGADAVTAALKTAVLRTKRPGVLAFSGSYHGLSYAPLAITDLRASYREPFRAQLSEHVSLLPFPRSPSEADEVLEKAAPLMSQLGAVIFEPIQGRAGVWPPPPGFLVRLCELARSHGTLTIADEIWTGLGRAGEWLVSSAEGAAVDLICLGKGLGGGLPISACIGSREVMNAWSQEEEVVHTSTFAGAPLACATAETTLSVLREKALVERSRTLGERFLAELQVATAQFRGVAVRGRGFMLGIDMADFPGEGRGLQRALLERGYLTSTGGGRRNVLVLTPALTTPEPLLASFVNALTEALESLN
jgi:4-aminobutyrate aminotransferase / (S)-3-amino-2-methylpropionate transaminase / 5-aminovalerate transaminase